MEGKKKNLCSDKHLNNTQIQRHNLWCFFFFNSVSSINLKRKDHALKKVIM